METLYPSGPRRARAGFTLTELLVAIAIIVLLAALLLPGIIRAAHGSHAAKCVSNLRQLGAGVARYHADYNQFPTGGWKNGVTWVSQIFPYIGSDKDVFYCPEGGTKGPGGLSGWDYFPAPYKNAIYSMHYAYNASINTDGSAAPAPGIFNRLTVSRSCRSS